MPAERGANGEHPPPPPSSYDIPPQAKELLLHKVDRLAREKPNVLYAQYPNSATSYEAGFRHVSYSAFANAVNGMARWLADHIAADGASMPTVAYIGPNDVRYPSLVLGASKAGYKMFMASPRNSTAAQWHLLKSLDCHVLLTPDPPLPAVTAILETLDPEHEVRVMHVPTVGEILGDTFPPFPYDKTFEEARHDPLVVLHTSGTTGMPKPIIWTQEYATILGRQLQLEPPEGYESNEMLYQGNRVFAFFPPFHAAYHAHSLVNAITNETCYIFPLPAAIPSAQGLSEALKQTRVDVAFVVPLMVEEMSKDDQLLNHISSNLGILVYAGGDVPDACGNKVAAKIKLMNYYGATEIGSVVNIRPTGTWDRKNWRYITFHPKTGMDFRHHMADIYELYVKRVAEEVENQPIFILFPELQEYRTRDLWKRHPTISNAWHHCGRADDIIVFINGEKTNPVTMEQHICASNAKVQAALVAGAKRFQAALLIEPKGNAEMSATQRAELLEEIWPSVEEGNRECPAHAKISKSHILFTKPGKPMQRTPKGTVRRRETMETYSAELDNLYRDADFVSIANDSTKEIDLDDTSAMIWLVKDCITKITGMQLNEDQNIFENGVDSLQALFLVRKLRGCFDMKQLSISTVYAYPSATRLVEAVRQLAKDRQKSADTAERHRKADIAAMLERYYSQVTDITPTIAAKHTISNGCADKQVVVLTGSTGGLGSYLLDTLLRDTSVALVYCLNRSSDAITRQQIRNRELGLTSNFGNRAKFLEADLSKMQLGLGDVEYNEILQSATTIIHNAWPVNFNLNLASFTPQLDGVLQLIHLTTTASSHPRLVFISSIGSVQSLSGSVPEQIIADDAAPGHTGYSESKYISERLFARASEALNIPVCIARVGQVAGAAEGPGRWNLREWLPSIIISSAHLRAVPASLPVNLNVVDWLPIDKLSKILASIALSSEESHPTTNGVTPLVGRTRTVHVRNPHAIGWECLVPEVTNAIAAAREGSPLELVSFDVWLRRVRDDLEGVDIDASQTPSTMRTEKMAPEQALERNPAVKLLGFFEEQMRARSRPELDTTIARQMSADLDAVGPVRAEWMTRWARSCLSTNS